MIYKKFIEHNKAEINIAKNFAIRSQDYKEAAFFREIETKFEQFLKTRTISKKGYKEKAIEIVKTKLKVNSYSKEIPFKLYEHQNRILETLLNNSHNVIQTPRQMGNSTLMHAYIASLAYVYQEPITIFVASHNNHSSKLNNDKISYFLSQLDIDFKEESNEIKTKYVKIVCNKFSNCRGYNVDYGFIMDVETYHDKIDKVGLKHIFNINSDIIYVSNGLKEIKSLYENINIIRLDWYEHPDFNHGLYWLGLNHFGETYKIYEEYFILESYEIKISKGMIPISPWFIYMTKILGEKAMLKEILHGD